MTAERQKHAPALDTYGHVLLQTRVGLVDDLVHCERRSGAVGVLGVVGGEGLGDLRQPVIQLRAARA